MSKMITISELKNLNQANGGFFFRRDTLKRNGETLKSYRVVSQGDRRLTVERKSDGKTWQFSIKTGRVMVGPDVVTHDKFEAAKNPTRAKKWR